MCPTDFSFGAPPRVGKFLLSEPPRSSYYQPTMAYRMRMFMSQKPSSVDLRVSDFKRVPGFNYVLSVSTEDEHTYNSLCSDIRRGVGHQRVKRPANLRVSRGIEGRVGDVCQHAEDVSERHVRLVCPAIRPRLGHVGGLD